MQCQVDKNVHNRYLLLFEFNRSSKTAEAARNICAIYEQDFLNFPGIAQN